MVFDDYVKGLKRLTTDMANQNMEMKDEMYCYAPLQGSNLATVTRLSSESLTRKFNSEISLTGDGLKDALLRMKSEESSKPIRESANVQTASEGSELVNRLLQKERRQIDIKRQIGS